jgi:hypothetical protein
MAYRLNSTSEQLIRGSPDALYLGVIEVVSGEIQLFVAGRAVDVGKREFPGHRELLQRGVISPAGNHGFFMQVRGGRLYRFYRNSIVNDDMPFCCLPAEEADTIAAACGIELAEDFECYP